MDYNLSQKQRCKLAVLSLPFLSMATAELVPNLWSSGLPEQDFDEESFFFIGRDHHLLDVGWYGTFVAGEDT